MDDDNWLTVGKPKKVKTGANKIVEEEKKGKFCNFNFRKYFHTKLF